MKILAVTQAFEEIRHHEAYVPTESSPPKTYAWVS